MLANQTLNSVYGSSEATRWVVMEGDWGGQIYLSIPVHLLPASTTFQQLVDVLKYIDDLSWDCNEGDGASMYLVEDRGWIDPDAECDWVAEAELGKGVSSALMFHPDAEPEADFPEGAVGGISGGMGGGFLLKDKIWMHSYLYTDRVDGDRVCSMLGAVSKTVH